MKKDLTQLHREFIQECEFSSKLSQETLRGYQASFDLLIKLVPNISPDIISPKVMTEFFRLLEKRERIVGKGITKKGIRKSTVATYRSKLNKFFEWLKNRNYLEKNPFREMEYPTVSYDDRKYLKKEQVEKIFISIMHEIKWKDNFLKKRNTALFSVLLYCGLRRNEILNLKVYDIDLDRKQLNVRGETSKSKRDRSIPLNSKVCMELKDYLDYRAKKKLQTNYLFVSDLRDDKLSKNGLKHLIDKIKRLSGLNFHAHQFRHTFAINLLNNGCDIAKVKQLLGHIDIRMTMAYLRCLPTKSMRADVETLSLDNLV